MDEIKRKAGALWRGDSKTGNGLISTESQALFERPYTHKTRFDGGDTTGTNPEELIAAAHAACFSMALASTLKKNGYDPKQTDTTATCTLTPGNGEYTITAMNLHVRADVPDIDESKFQKMVMEADKGCPVSNLLRDGLKIDIEATLL
jgi:lipoyl-dependent peroxiredoxin